MTPATDRAAFLAERKPLQRWTRAIGRRVSLWLFREFLQDMIEHYVRRERNRWAEAFEHEKLRNAQIIAHRDALLALLVDQESTRLPGPWVMKP